APGSRQGPSTPRLLPRSVGSSGSAGSSVSVPAVAVQGRTVDEDDGLTHSLILVAALHRGAVLSTGGLESHGFLPGVSPVRTVCPGLVCDGGTFAASRSAAPNDRALWKRSSRSLASAVR